MTIKPLHLWVFYVCDRRSLHQMVWNTLLTLHTTLAIECRILKFFMMSLIVVPAVTRNLMTCIRHQILFG
jgi:hypothetical protein